LTWTFPKYLIKHSHSEAVPLWAFNLVSTNFSVLFRTYILI
jgi:hypothetical protein